MLSIASRANRRQSGFTIVELLIVIVVIAILAAISIVAYTGIQNRANNAALLSAVDAYEKGFRLYYAKHGTIPPDITDFGGILAAFCLGENYPEAGLFEEGGCALMGDDSTTVIPLTYASDSLNASLGEVMGTLPETSHLNPVLIDSVEGFKVMYRGLMLTVGGWNTCSGGGQCSYVPSGILTIRYSIHDDQECGRGVKRVEVMNGATVTVCDTEMDFR